MGQTSGSVFVSALLANMVYGNGHVRRKASFSTSPLANPDTLVHQLASEIQNFLHFPEPSALYVTLGTVAANMIHGNPVWMILVGPPSCGKTEMLEMLTDLPQTRVVSVIKSPSVLLSGTGKRDIGKDSTGGLLREIGNRGMLLMTDMAGMLKLPRDPLGEVLAAFRDIYGGRWVRPIGTDGGRSLVWGPLKKGDPFGKLTFLAGSTSAIDRHHQLNAELGERWVYYRFAETDGHGETQSALRNKDPESSRQIMRQLVSNFFSVLEMNFDRLTEKREFTAYEEMRLESMAMLSVRARSEVPRDGFTKEIVDVSDSERPTRLATVLGQLYLGLEAIGLPESERWWLVSKVALDSVPRLRSEVVKAIWNGSRQGTLKVELTRLTEQMKMLRSQKTIVRVVEDLSIHGIVELHQAKGEKSGVGLTELARHLLSKGWDGELK